MEYSENFRRLFDRKNPSPRICRVDEAGLRALCAESVKAFPGIEPFKTFSIVGATIFDLDLHPNNPFKPLKYGQGFDETVTYDEVSPDTDRFRNFVFYLIRSGIPVSADFTVRTPNLIAGEDYLETDYQSDAVIQSYLVNRSYDDLVNPKEDMFPEYDKRMKYKIFDASDPEQKKHIDAYKTAIQSKEYSRAWLEAKYLGGVCSPLSSPENWSKRLRQADPKIVMTYHAMDSLPIHLEGNNAMASILPSFFDPYRKLIAAEIAQKGYTPFSVDIALSNPFLDDAAGKLTDETLLAMKIKHARFGRHLPSFKGHDGHGHFEDFTHWIPYAPFKMPTIGRDLRDMDYLDAFWSLAENPEDPEFDNILLRHWIKNDRDKILSDIEGYFGSANEGEKVRRLAAPCVAP